MIFALKKKKLIFVTVEMYTLDIGQMVTLVNMVNENKSIDKFIIKIKIIFS